MKKRETARHRRERRRARLARKADRNRNVRYFDMTAAAAILRHRYSQASLRTYVYAT